MKKQIKKLFTLILALSLLLTMVTGCSNSTNAADENPPAENPSDDSTAKVILAVSFGTSYNDNRDLSIGGIEKALQEAYPDYEVRRAFTSQIIIDKLKDRDGLEIDNVTEAMDRLVADGIKEVVIQPTHVMNGFEYDDIINEVSVYKDKFESFKVGKQLLASDEDFKEIVSVITEETKSYDTEGTAIVFMGHGTEHESNAVYSKVQQYITDAGHDNYFMGTVEATPSLDDVVALVKESGANKVVLLPFMIVAGDHANNDMAGDEEDSWKSAFEAEGFEVETVLKGMGEYTGVQNMIVKHLGETIDQSANEENVPAEDTEDLEAEEAQTLHGDQIKDGTYQIEVSSSSSMFRIIDAQLTVASGEMSAVITLSGTGYEKLYMGTGEEALADTDDKCIYYVEDSEGKYTYEVPVVALNQDINCAAWSINKEAWYDRVLVFQSSMIPEEAVE